MTDPSGGLAIISQFDLYTTVTVHAGYQFLPVAAIVHGLVSGFILLYLCRSLRLTTILRRNRSEVAHEYLKQSVIASLIITGTIYLLSMVLVLLNIRFRADMGGLLLAMVIQLVSVCVYFVFINLVTVAVMLMIHNDAVAILIVTIMSLALVMIDFIGHSWIRSPLNLTDNLENYVLGKIDLVGMLSDVFVGLGLVILTYVLVRVLVRNHDYVSIA